MARLTEEMVIARSKQSDLSAIKKLNCWGAELGDVSLLRRMPNVEVLALSINKIRTLEDFASCRRLRELYIRKNEIPHLDEIRHLRELQDLTSLWLDENPCTEHPEYRMTVLRNLPNLEKLDNVVVQPEEVAEAMRRGLLIPDSDDEGYPQQEYSEYRRARSPESSPEREPPPPRRAHEGSDNLEAWCESAPDTARSDNQQCPLSPSAAAPAQHSAMTRSHIDRASEARGDAALRHSVSAQSVKEYGYSCNGVTSPQHYHDSYSDRAQERCESYQQLPQHALERDRASGGDSARERDREYPSAVMAERRGFTRRPVTRNSNLLSAVLCLVKELDYPSLEVAEMAVRCRMDELANGQ